MNGHMHIFENTDALYFALEKQWLEISQAAIADHGAFHVALAGGSTPRKLYEKLAQNTALDKTCWHKTHIYFGDERCVPQDHSESNYRMATESLFSVAPILPEHVHTMFSMDLSVEENTTQYQALLLDTLPLDATGNPVFDLVLLGMGEDGHTASLFPDTDILQESSKLVAAQFVQKLDAWRISLTFPVINAASHVAVLVAGKSKAKILQAIYSAENTTDDYYPIQRVNPSGQLDWYLDVAAAHLINARL